MHLLVKFIEIMVYVVVAATVATAMLALLAVIVGTLYTPVEASSTPRWRVWYENVVVRGALVGLVMGIGWLVVQDWVAVGVSAILALLIGWRLEWEE
jgi:hypothetical protein